MIKKSATRTSGGRTDRSLSVFKRHIAEKHPGLSDQPENGGVGFRRKIPADRKLPPLPAGGVGKGLER